MTRTPPHIWSGERACLSHSQASTALKTGSREMLTAPACGPTRAVPQEKSARAFLNTLDLELRSDALQTTEGLRAWVAAWLPNVAGAAFTDDDRRRAVSLREALRSVAAANSPSTAGAAAVVRLNDEAENLPLILRFSTSGVRLGAAPGTRHPLGAAILGIVAVATINGSWERLKICPAPDCLWAFYDHSKNRMGVWCQMGECGNRHKVRRHRERRRSQATVKASSPLRQ
ncbi:CGNR zinc finger domain-containing protein [Actinoplanes siamensis]|uniref:Zinc finger CGNR domain-containing protein n=1 Tax=Actinoplanes siamensis TaxID=1223317 RepID=A0A919NCL8_9ACTN|nr:CGNR zinc finger domain-containing protein [Actinoplanes siamensis]GIF08190.1 hypothetical protein Asi03nite_57280 [Actinoplanes siamensis]